MPEPKKPKLIPPYIAIMCLILEFVFLKFFPQFKIINAPVTYFGIFLIGIGATLTLSAIAMFRKNNTPVVPGTKPTFVVMKGPYTFTRNPMYLGLTFILIGAGVWIGNALSIACFAIFVVYINSTFIPREEKMMENLFGQKYLGYKSKVRRWL